MGRWGYRMDIETAVYTQLKNHSGLANLCSTRCYPIMLPQSPTLPATTYARVSTVREQMFGGPAGLARPRFQVTAWGSTFSSARAVATQVRAALDGFTGLIGSSGGVQGDATLINEIDLIDPETGWYYVVLDFEIWHNE